MITGTKGKAVSRGGAGTLQKTAANVGFQGMQSIVFTPPGGLPGSFASVTKKAGASSSSGHKGSTKKNGALAVENLGGTELRRENPGERDEGDGLTIL